MAIEDIDLGTIPLDGTDGDTAREAFTKVNGNFEDLDTRVTALENEPEPGTVSSVNGILPNSSGNVSLTAADVGAATTAQGLLADSAVQPSSLGTAAYLDANDFATNEQGALADTAVQPAQLEEYERVLIAGDGITIDRSNPDNPVISSSGGTGTGTVTSVAGVSPSPDGNVPQTDLVTALGVDDKVDKVEGKQLSTEDYTNQEKLKLAAIAPQATQNQTDAYLLSRANHTGTQTSSTISDFAATVRSTLLTGLGAGANAVIAATDTLLQSLAKLQAQVSAKLTNPMTTSGDIIVGGTDGVAIRLARGLPGQVLKVNTSGTALEYGNSSGVSFYESPETAWTAGGTLTFTHNLEGIPRFVSIEAVMVATQGQNPLGVRFDVSTPFASGNNYFNCQVIDKTAITITIRVATGLVRLHSTTGGDIVTAANSRLVLRAQA